MALWMIRAAGLLTWAGGVGGASAPEASVEVQMPREMAVSFLEAFVSESGKPFIAECAAEAGDAKEDLQDALDELKEALHNKDLDDVSKALRDLADMLDEVPEALTHCKEGAASVRETADDLKELLHEGPLKTMWQHAVDDHVRITSELDAGIAAFANQNYTASGGQLGRALRHLIVSKQHDLTALGDNTTKLATLVAFLNGFLDGDGGYEFTKCTLHLFYDGTRALDTAKGLLTALHDKNLTEISDALTAISTMLDSLEPYAEKGCSDYLRITRETINALKELKTQGHVAKAVEGHLLADHKNITGELDSFLVRSGATDTVGAGEHLGKFLRLLLVGELQEPAPSIVV